MPPAFSILFLSGVVAKSSVPLLLSVTVVAGSQCREIFVKEGRCQIEVDCLRRRSQSPGEQPKLPPRPGLVRTVALAVRDNPGNSWALGKIAQITGKCSRRVDICIYCLSNIFHSGQIITHSVQF